MLSIDDLQHSSTSLLFLSLVRGSGANQGVAIYWQLIEMSGLLGEVYTKLYRAVHRAQSAIRNNGVSAFQGGVYTGRIGSSLGLLESVCIIEVSAFQGCPQSAVPLYILYTYMAGRLYAKTNPIHVYTWQVECV